MTSTAAERSEKYSKTEKGKRTQEKYRKSAKGKKSRKRYKQSEKGKISLKKYNQSEKGKAARKRFYRTEHGEKTKRAQSLKDNYGITLEQYDEMLENQNGICAICKKPETRTTGYGFVRRFAVDHNHETGKVRALLCSRCNQELGVYENRKKELENYLRKFK